MKTRKAMPTASAALLLMAAWGEAARAQYSTAPIPSWYDYGVMRQQTLNGWRLRSSRNRRPSPPSRTGRPTSSPPPSGTRHPNPTPNTTGASTSFRPVAASLVPQQLAAKTPAHRKEADEFFNRLLEAYREMARDKGAPLNDVARAAAFSLLSSYYVYNGRETLTPQQMEAVRRQMREMLLDDADFQRLGDRQKQELYESYVILGMFVGSIYDGASKRGDKTKVAEMRELARRQLEGAFGVPVGQLRFTDAGVEF